jgi:hypothetical protein
VIDNFEMIRHCCIIGFFFGFILGWIDFFAKYEFQIAWGLKSCVLVPRCHIPPLSPEDFKNRMGIAKKLQNENTRPINSVDLAYMQ